MGTLNIVALISLMIINVAVMYLPSYFTKKLDTVRWRELHKKHPESGWIRWAFLPMYLSWLGILFYGPKILPIMFDTGILYYWYANFFAAIGFFFSLFSVITQVLVIPMSAPILLFATGSKAFKLARIHLMASMGMIIANSIIVFVALSQSKVNIL